MCRICVDYANGKLTMEEALRNLDEMPPSIHTDEVFEMLMEDVTKEAEEDFELFWLDDNKEWLDNIGSLLGEH